MRTRLSLGRLGSGYPLSPAFVLAALVIAEQLDQSAFTVLSPDIRDSFHLSNTGLGAVVVLLIPVVLLLALPIGYLADRRRRTALAGGGAALWGGFALLTGLAPSVGVLAGARCGAGIGRSVIQPTHQSLLADYYPPQARMGVFSLWRSAVPAGLIAGPLMAGALGSAFGWRVPFLVIALPTIGVAMLALRLPEPIRGAHERAAQGADEELRGVEEAPPTWEESWRTLNGVRTLRRAWRSLPFMLGGILSATFLLPLYYDKVFHVDTLGRGVLSAIIEPFQLLGILIGAPICSRLMRSRPSRVLSLFGLFGSVAALGLAVVAVAPNVQIAAAGAAWVTFWVAMLTPGFSAVTSLITPPRARSFGFSVVDLWVVPGLIFVLIGASLGDHHGFRIAIASMIPVFLTGAYILASAGGHVAADTRAAQLSSVAQAEFRRSRAEGDPTLLTCRGIDVSYGQVQVLFGVDFDVRDGEMVALLGTNGAGKSTLLKAIAGLVDPSGGAIVFDGRDMTYASAQQALRSGIVLMPGGRSVFPTLTVRENLAAACWLVGRRALSDDLIAPVLARFPRLEERIDQPAGNLSGGEQQMLGLSMAFLAEPKLLMIDELSLGLAPTIVEQLLVTVRDIHARGTTVILVEQSVNVALTLAERAVFMEKGEVRFEGATRDLLDQPEILRSVFLEGAGRQLGRRGADGTPDAAAPVARVDVSAAPLLSVEGLSRSFGGVRAVDDVSFHVQPGEVVGLIGPNGAGKTTLFDLISGFVQPDAGRLRFDGVDITDWSPERRGVARIGRSFQDAALFPSMTVTEAIKVAHDRHLRRRGVASALLVLPEQRVEERLLADRAAELITLMGLESFADKFVAELSTGSRRIVDLACALAHDPQLLLLDEPSSGIAQREAEALGPLLLSIRDLTGAALLVIEHDMPLISSISDRIVALDLGAVLTAGEPAAVVSHPKVIASYLGSDSAAITRSGAPTLAASGGQRP
jgi:ABC-type branched-subunit amino acid transport system ATPase component